MKNYVEASIELLEISSVDVITTSGGSTQGGLTSGGEGSNDNPIEW